MKFSIEKLRAELTEHEGLRLRAYKDSVGIWTCGVGRNLQDMTISREIADLWLDEDIATAANELILAFPFTGELSDIHQRVLINMTFNLGITRLKKFKKMWAALESGDYGLAANEMMDSKWADQVGIRANQLALMMLAGE